MPTVESLPLNGLAANSTVTDRDRSRSRSSDKLLDNDYKKRTDEELPLSFASFYYSLKVLKGKGIFES